uniref:PIEZO domain-containing protein n=1 Tax=Ascaris lumbricoides TaxID=6252 RepID=A0A0M3I8P1_ASCLU
METLLHFFLRCMLALITFILFGITTAVVEKSILSIFYFILLAAFVHAAQVSLLNIPQMVFAVLLCYTRNANLKVICYLAMGLYIPLTTVIKLAFFVYHGPLSDLRICENVNAEKWMYWTGLISDETSIYVPVLCLMAIHLHSIIEYLYVRYEDRYRECDTKLQFPDINYKNAGYATVNLIAFYINYGYYKFGFEVCSVSYIRYIGRQRKILQTIITPENAPYLALFNGGYLARKNFDLTLFLYFINVILSLMQYELFKIESANDKNFGGGSNDGVFEDVDDDGQSSKVNPIRNFYSQDARLFLDDVKQCVFSYYHWLVLLLVFSNGIRMTAPVFLSIGHIIFAFLNFWRGTDLYLSSLRIFRRKWRVITLYLLGSLFLQISALISKAMLDEFVTTKNGYKRLVAICRMLHVYFKKPGATIIDTMQPYKDADVRAYSFDVIVFAALLLQLRMIVSWLVIAYIDVTTFETFWELENSENSFFFFLIFL